MEQPKITPAMIRVNAAYAARNRAEEHERWTYANAPAGSDERQVAIDALVRADQEYAAAHAAFRAAQ